MVISETPAGKVNKVLLTKSPASGPAADIKSGRKHSDMLVCFETILDILIKLSRVLSDKDS